jgi:hypothetical protein
MALDDIAYGGTASMNIDCFIMTMERGNIGEITDILAPADGSFSNTMESKIPTPISGGEVSVTFVT